MNFFIRCDGSYKIGSGHIARCLNLAKVLIKNKHTVYFISNEINKNFKNFILKNKIKLIFLKKSFNQVEDAKKTITKIKKFYKDKDWVIVDNYKLGFLWEKKVNHYCKKIFVIDDLENKKHQCSLFLNQNLFKKKINMNNFLKKKPKLLIGPKYALLDENFNKLRRKIKLRKKIKNIMLFFGASDKKNMTDKCTNILLDIIPKNVKLNLVIGGTNENRKKINENYHHNKKINIYFNLPNLAKIMKKADVFIGSGGVTTWERCCLRLPSIVISTAKNQESHSRYLSDKNAIKYLGNQKKLNESQIKREFMNLFKGNSLKKLSINSSKITDGLGCIRVYKEILKN